MEHSAKFAMVSRFYNTLKQDGTRMWSKPMVENAVVKGWITAQELRQITKEEEQSTKGGTALA